MGTSPPFVVENGSIEKPVFSQHENYMQWCNMLICFSFIWIPSSCYFCTTLRRVHIKIICINPIYNSIYINTYMNIISSLISPCYYMFAERRMIQKHSTKSENQQRCRPIAPHFAILPAAMDFSNLIWFPIVFKYDKFGFPSQTADCRRLEPLSHFSIAHPLIGKAHRERT